MWSFKPSIRRELILWFYRRSHSTAAQSVAKAPELSRSERRQQKAQVLDLLAALKSCSASRNIESGRRIHAAARESGLDSHKFVASTLVTMYSRCGSIQEAQKVFETIQQPDVVLWNSLLIGYVENEEGEVALELFQRLLSQRCVPTPRTFGAALKACSLIAGRETGKEVDGKLLKASALQTGRSIHSLITTGPLGSSDLFVASALVTMYSKCGSLGDAVMVFERMPLHDIISWGSLMMGYAENGEENLALKLFISVPPQGTLDAAIFVAALKACAGLAVKEDGRLLDGKLVKVEALERGMAVHARAANAGFEFHLFVSSSLIDVYAKCRSMVNAQRVFDRMPCHNLISWTSLMLGYAEIEDGERALELFSSMQRLTSFPDAGSFVSALKACTSLSEKEEAKLVNGRLVKEESLKKGMAIHSQLRRCGCESDVSVAVSLVDMYAKCGNLNEARKVFESMATQGIVSWTALALGYAENGEEEVVLELFSQTQPEEQALELDSPAFLAVLKACTSLASKEQGEIIGGRLVKLKSLQKGMKLHTLALRNGLESSPYVAATLVDMYSNCGSMADARAVFDRMEMKTPASWNALLLGYCENNEEKLALELLRFMAEKNGRTFAIALKACGAVATLETTKEVHAGICRAGLEADIVLISSLIDVYAKCGGMFEAERMFNSCSEPDLVTYTALISGYSRTGESEQVFGLFSEMQGRGLQANEVTLLCLLTACSHSGLVELARRYFSEMFTLHRVEPKVEHYICMVDVLSRGNRLDEAVELVERMPFQAGSVAWMTILGACWKWKNVKLGKLAFDRLVALDDKQSAAYDLMANIYGSSNMAEEKSQVQQLKVKQEI